MITNAMYDHENASSAGHSEVTFERLRNRCADVRGAHHGEVGPVSRTFAQRPHGNGKLVESHAELLKRRLAGRSVVSFERSQVVVYEPIGFGPAPATAKVRVE